jgi:hypothetical protein
MTKKHSKKWPFAAHVLAALASACAAPLDDEARLDDEAQAGEAADQIGVALQELGSTLNPLPARGGTGGFPVSLQGVLINGINVRSGKFVDNIQLAFYIPSQPDNRFRQGDQTGFIGPVGGDGGSPSGWQFCPDGFAAVGLQGAAGRYVDRLGLICGRVDNPASTFTTPVFGGPGGAPFFDVCGSQGFLSGADVRAGKLIDQVRGNCIAAN